jgi:hypothetical protein
MRLRQFVFVAEKLKPAVDDITAVLGLNVCFNDPGVGKFGLENALLPINGNFLEIVAPVQEGTTAGRYLARRGGDGGYMVILQCADAEKERERIAALGVRDVWRHDGEDVIATHYHPGDVPGAILSIDTMHPGSNFHREASYWKWAGPDWTEYVRTDVTQAIVAVEIQASNPVSVASQWGKVLGRPVKAGAQGPEVAFDNARIRFVSERDDHGLGVSAIDVVPQDRDRILAAAEARGLLLDDQQISLCGVRVNLI